jgi:hypothetical protein
VHCAGFENISVHALNTLLVGLEILLTNMQPPPWAYMLPVFILLALYLALAYVTYATQHFYSTSAQLPFSPLADPCAQRTRS